MGCNVSPYRGGVLKYKKTQTVNVTYTDTTTAHALLTADKPYICKVTGTNSANNCYQKITVNGEQVGASDSYSLPYLNVATNHKKVLSSVGVNSNKGGSSGVLLLLETGDDLKTTLTSMAGQSSISATFTLNIYEWD